MPTELMVSEVLNVMGNQLQVIPTNKNVKEVNHTNLEELGFKTAFKKLDSAKKMAFAFSKYLFVTQDKINIFNEKLRVDTMKEDKTARSYKRLAMIPVEQYNEIPPDFVLKAMSNAKADNCFDEFVVAKIEWFKEVKDPILFGKINGCTDYFFISQWDDDVKFEDILFTEK